MKRGQTALGLSLLLASLAAAIVGCSLISTSDLAGPARCDGGDCTASRVANDASIDAPVTTSDACTADVQMDSANCGSCGHTCGGGQMCSRGACVAGCAGNVIYVSGNAGGNDSNDGCTQKTPKKSIGNALAFAKSTKLATQEIHVCGGTFTEKELVVDFPVSLLGGWDCELWVRVGTYGYPTFNPFNRTVIQPDAANLSGETMSVSGLGTTGVATVDGFTIYSPPSSLAEVTSAGIFVFGGGLPILSNDDLEGAAASSARTVGVLVSIGSDPEITHDTINGGGGQNGSTGIIVNGGGIARIHDNVIGGGSGMFSTSTGIELIGGAAFVGDHAILHNTISGGQGAYDGKNLTSIGVVVNDTVAEVLGNVITGGAGTSAVASGNVSVEGVFVTANAFATIAGNRIEGGTASGSDSNTVNGIFVTNSGSAWIVNNAIHAAGEISATRGAFAIAADHGGSLTVDQNTLYGSQMAIRVNDGTTLAATNNLLLGESSVGSFGVLFQNCTAGSTPTLRLVDNAFVGFGANILQRNVVTSGKCGVTSVASIAALEGSTDISASGNRRVVADCSGEVAARCFAAPSCPADNTSGASCITTVIGTWDPATQGGADLADDTRTWKLAPNAPCLVTQGGGDILPDLADAGVSQTGVDIVPVPRTPPTSLGAYESDLACTN